MKLISLCMLALLFCQPGQAYIPRTKTIVKKMIRNNGYRDYRLVREVALQTADKQINVKEVWTIANGDTMKLEVSSTDAKQPWQFVVVYKKKQRHTLTSSNTTKTFKKSRDFFEPLFHDRYHTSLLKRLVNFQFVPNWAIDTPEPKLVEGKTKMTPEPFVALEAMSGTVNYALGAKSQSPEGRAQTQLWVEQDSFLIRKGRLNSGAEFTNSNFQTYMGGLKLPGEQTISWKDRRAKVKLVSAERVKTSRKTWTLKPPKVATLPTDPLVKEFYSRFR